MATNDTLTIDPSAIVDAGAEIGEGTKVWHFTHVCKGAKVGRNCSLGQNVYVAPRAVIGNNVRIQNNVSLYDEVVLEDDVFCGPSCVFTNVINPRAHIPRKNEYKKTLVKKGTTIGANATILCGNTLGEYSFIAAGAVVHRDVLPYELVGGVPIKRLRAWLDGGELSKEDRELLCKDVAPDFIGKVIIN